MKIDPELLLKVAKAMAGRMERWRDDVKQHLAKISDDELFLLKAHLLLEEQLDRLIVVHCPHPEHLEAVNLRFFQKLKLVQSLVKVQFPTECWQLLENFNKLRNKLAHKLDEKLFNKLLSEAIDILIKQFKFPEDELDTRQQQIRWLIISLCLFLNIVEITCEVNNKG